MFSSRKENKLCGNYTCTLQSIKSLYPFKKRKVESHASFSNIAPKGIGR